MDFHFITLKLHPPVTSCVDTKIIIFFDSWRWKSITLIAFIIILFLLDLRSPRTSLSHTNNETETTKLYLVHHLHNERYI